MITENKLATLFVGDILTDTSAQPTSINESESIRTVLKTFLQIRKNNIICVTDNTNKFTGVIRTREVIKRIFPLTTLSTEGIRKIVDNTPNISIYNAKNMMETLTCKITKDTPLSQVILLFLKENITSYPVLDNKDNITGEITIGTIVDYVLKNNSRIDAL